tara:strand:+ start:152 stop:358 length:207 start_codon:yes stop_codon:yes gene_type:complete
MNTNLLQIKLNEILHNIQNNNITTSQLEIIKEFILKMQFSEKSNHFSEKDMMKYLSVGWYICENINNL